MASEIGATTLQGTKSFVPIVSLVRRLHCASCFCLGVQVKVGVIVECTKTPFSLAITSDRYIAMVSEIMVMVNELPQFWSRPAVLNLQTSA